MNIIEEIKKQVENITAKENSIYLDAISLHLERAEYYYMQGDNDSDYFNDVIYRTNQAFEGALKEAYRVLASKTEEEVSKETPHKIEKYLEHNDVLKERVLELFKNYRNEWRNKSTHDYKLFFNDDEAFIALTSVSSFVFLLLKQIMKRLAYNEEQESIHKSKKRQDKITSILETKSEALDLITSLLIDFVETHKLDKDKTIFEAEFLGMLSGFLSASKNSISIEEEPHLPNGLRPDYIIDISGEKVILEVTKSSLRSKINQGTEQLLTYLKHAGIEKGIILIVSTNLGSEGLKIEERDIKIDDSYYKIKVIEATLRFLN